MSVATETKPKRRFVRPSWPVIIAGILIVALIATLVNRFVFQSTTTTAINGTPTAVTRGDLVSSISATGKVEPLQESQLAFGAREGRVAEIMVNVGDQVNQDATLIKLETRQLEAAVAAAQAALDQAKADLQGLNDGATPEQIAAAAAQVAAAQGNLRQTEGSVTGADLQAARLQLEEARARVQLLTGNPDANDLARARTSVAEAETNLSRQSTLLSATKLQAERTVELRANQLRDAQATYDQALRDRERALNDDNDPRTGARLTDSQREQYVIAAQTAERAMQDAEQALAQARIDLDTAKQNEITGLADAQARLDRAKADLNSLLNPSADSVAAARAQLAAAEARLAQLTGDQRSGAVAAQQANLEVAQARLAELQADPRSSDLARAQARVAQAEAQLLQAQIQLDDATLRAPFGGIISEIGVAVGEQISAQSPLTLIDVSRYIVKVTVDEVDVARVQLGQPVEVLIDAFGLPALQGTVKRIAPQAVAGSQVTSYELTLEVDPGSRPVKAGMTASATVIIDRKTGVISVPTVAVREENGQSVVTVVSTDANGRQQTSVVPVQLGLRTTDRVEIVSGLTEGQQVLLPN